MSYLWIYQRSLIQSITIFLAKLHAYGFSKNPLNLMCSYLKNRKQIVQVNDNFSATKTIIAGIPQDLIDGPLLFN